MWPTGKRRGPAGNGEGRGPAGAMVGPFGNGAGATGENRSLLMTSPPFGDNESGVGRRTWLEESKDSSFNRWRKQGGPEFGVGRVQRLAERRLVDSHNEGGDASCSQESSHWIPQFPRSSTGLPISAVPASGRIPEQLMASEGFQAGSSENLDSSSGPSLTTAPVCPPKQANAPSTEQVVHGKGERRNSGGSGGGIFSDSGFSSFGAGAGVQARRTPQPAAAGRFGTTIALEVESTGCGIEEDDEEDDENPFA